MKKHAFGWKGPGMERNMEPPRPIPNREFIVEKNFMMPYYGTPQPPQEYMTVDTN